MKILIYLILIMVLSGPAYFNLMRSGYFSMHDDVQVMRLFEMKKCFQDGQIPCRWVPDMGAGYGHPLYNYHPVFPYYLGMVFRLAGLSLIVTAKILFWLSLVLAGVAMFILVKEFFGSMAGLVAAMMYIYAPYHAVDVFVRGALTESWGMAWFPLILWSLYKLIKQTGYWYLVMATLSMTGLFLSHNLMMLIFSPVIVAWIITWMVVLKSRDWRVWLSLVWALGLSSFFVIPALIETSLLNIGQVQGYYSFQDHFVDLNQLFLSRHWGYGPSIAGFGDDLSFQIGWPHWWLAVVGIIGLVMVVRRQRTASWWVGVFAAILMVVAIWMATPFSSLVWQRLSLIAYVQFPWRFLAIIIFANAVLVGVVIAALGSRAKLLVSVLVIALVVGLNYQYFTANIYYSQRSDQEMLAGSEWARQSLSTLADYVPKAVKELPVTLAPNGPEIRDGVGEVSNYLLKSNSWSFQANIKTSHAVVSVPVFNFPNWRVLVDGQPWLVTDDNSYGLITLRLGQGSHQIKANLADTLVRQVANLISLISIGLLLVSLGRKIIKR